MRFLFSLLTIGLLVPGFVMAKEGKTINVAAPSIRICGQTVSWRLIFNTITNKEAECLDSMSPLEVSALGISEGATNSVVEISQKKIVDLLKPVRQMCLSDADLLLPEKLSILREKQLTDGVLQTWILDQLMIHFSDKTAEIVRVHMPKIDCSTVGLVSWDSLRIEGNNRFRFLLTVDEKNFSIGGEFRLFQMIPTLNRSTLVNQKIEASDLEVKKKDVTFLNNYIKKVEDLIGRTLNVSLMAGEPIQMRHLKEEKFVEKGQMVQIQYKTESFVVSAIGIAEQSGTFGDFVKIKNPDSQKVLSAIVSGKGLVEVQ